MSAAFAAFLFLVARLRVRAGQRVAACEQSIAPDREAMDSRSSLTTLRRGRGARNVRNQRVQASRMPRFLAELAAGE
jgi:hypothetical protein